MKYTEEHGNDSSARGYTWVLICSQKKDEGGGVVFIPSLFVCIENHS
jgi:hypothetical protein